jgi:hypothetical protein
MTLSNIVVNIRELVDEIKEENNFNKLFQETGKKDDNTDENEENIIDSISVENVIENADYYDNNYWQNSLKNSSLELEI